MLKILRLSLLFCLYIQIVSVNAMCCRRQRQRFAEHYPIAPKTKADCCDYVIYGISAISTVSSLYLIVDPTSNSTVRCLGVMYCGLNSLAVFTSARVWLEKWDRALDSAAYSAYLDQYVRAMRTRSERSDSRLIRRSSDSHNGIRRVLRSTTRATINTDNIERK